MKNLDTNLGGGEIRGGFKFRQALTLSEWAALLRSSAFSGPASLLACIARLVKGDLAQTKH